jgi:hypothetical protein
MFAGVHDFDDFDDDSDNDADGLHLHAFVGKPVLQMKRSLWHNVVCVLVRDKFVARDIYCNVVAVTYGELVVEFVVVYNNFVRRPKRDVVDNCRGYIFVDNFDDMHSAAVVDGDYDDFAAILIN